MIVRCLINGRPLELETEPDRRVVDLLREDLELLGTKEGCGSGECGTCTMLVDGVPKLSCLMLAVQLEGRSIVTVEGLGSGTDPHPNLHPVQQALPSTGPCNAVTARPGWS